MSERRYDQFAGVDLTADTFNGREIESAEIRDGWLWLTLRGSQVVVVAIDYAKRLDPRLFQNAERPAPKGGSV